MIQQGTMEIPIFDSIINKGDLKRSGCHALKNNRQN